MLDLNLLLKLKQTWNLFCSDHPRVPAFLNDVKGKGFCPGQEIAVAVRYPDGTEYETGIRVTQRDLQLLDLLKNLK